MAATQALRADRPIRRIPFFADRYDWMGPAIVALSLWYFAAQALVAAAVRPRYSFISNVISDLGRTDCAQHSICSPRHLLMNVSIGILGFAMIVGAVLIFSEFSFAKHHGERIAARVGFWCLALGGAGAILVAFFPENVNTTQLHTVGYAMAVALGQLAIVILAVALRELDDWLRWFMLVTSLIVLLAGACIVFRHSFGIGAGLLERLAQYPETVWLILFGFYICRDHYRNGVVGRGLKLAQGRLLTQRPAWMQPPATVGAPAFSPRLPDTPES